jgi:hypothetical protein
MTWSTLPLQPNSRMLRQFAAAWVVVFLSLGAQQYFLKGHPRHGLALAAIALLVGIPGLVRPALVKWIFITAMVAAFPLGWVVSNLMLAFMFYGIVTPLALIFKLRGRDALLRRPQPGRASFWIPKPTPQDVRSYFRQY